MSFYSKGESRTPATSSVGCCGVSLAGWEKGRWRRNCLKNPCKNCIRIIYHFSGANCFKESSVLILFFFFPPILCIKITLLFLISCCLFLFNCLFQVEKNRSKETKNDYAFQQVQQNFLQATFNQYLFQVDYLCMVQKQLIASQFIVLIHW